MGVFWDVKIISICYFSSYSFLDFVIYFWLSA